MNKQIAILRNEKLEETSFGDTCVLWWGVGDGQYPDGRWQTRPKDYEGNFSVAMELWAEMEKWAVKEANRQNSRGVWYLSLIKNIFGWNMQVSVCGKTVLWGQEETSEKAICDAWKKYARIERPPKYVANDLWSLVKNGKEISGLSKKEAYDLWTE